MSGNNILAVFVCVLIFYTFPVNAQTFKSPTQIKILNNYGSIPFEDGKTVIAEIRFTGLDTEDEEYDEAIGRTITEKNLQSHLKDERTPIYPGEKFYGSQISKVVKKSKEFLSRYGYLNAEVVALGELLPKDQMRLIIEIKRGLPARVSEIRFEDNVHISDEEYLENFKQCSGDGWKIFYSRKYEFYAEKCSRELMFSKGYFQGSIDRILPEIENGNYVVTFTLKEGTRYLIGDIKIKGSTVFKESELLEMLNFKTGDVANGTKIRDFFYEKLKRIYEDKGYVSFDSEFDPEFIEPQAEQLDGTVNINAWIGEGEQFKIRKIQFIGTPEIKITPEEEFELTKSSSLKETEIFSRTKLEEAVEKLNESKRFYYVDSVRDVEIRIPILSQNSDEASGLKLGNVPLRKKYQHSPELDIIIKVIKIQK